MVYILVLFGSFAGICLILGARVLLRTRSVRTFVRSIRSRTDSLEKRTVLPETEAPQQTSSTRASAIELQKVRTLLRTAEKVLARGKTDEAERLLIEALTVRKDARDVQTKLANLYLSTARPSKAEALYRDLLRTGEDADLFASLGLALYQQRRFIESCDCYRSAYERDNKTPERAATLGQALVAAGEIPEALPLLEKAAERMARDTELLHLIADCYLRQSDKEGALSAFSRINRLVPYDKDVKEKMAALAA